MCGIAGLFNVAGIVSSTEEAEYLLGQMNDSMVHRGPDGEGIWIDPRLRCGVAHRRLSIIDTSFAGRQPMVSANDQWVISFNGEIYNFQEIQPELVAAGVQLRGRTDTEVLLEAIALWGLNALPKLDGMFAFAAFNKDTGELILARDPFGEKPLYYMELPRGGLAFASELQALECLPWFEGDVSADSIGELLMFQYIGAPRTIYRSVKKLEPGCWLLGKADIGLTKGRYFEFKPGSEGFTDQPLEELVDELDDILTRSVRRRLISDVPLGAFLSGGVDSSTVCALVHKKLERPLKTFSIGFENTPESEHEAARMFARHLETEHHDQILAPHTSEFLLDIGRLLDEPNGDSSCMPTYLLSRYARQFVTVALSGDGGDEMFCGYGRYFSTLDEAERARRGELPGWRPGQAYYANRILVSVEKHIRELFGFMPEGLTHHLATLRNSIEVDAVPLMCRLRKSDVDHYMPGAVLPKVDRMSMQHSLEVRTPFLNTELSRFCERIPPKFLYDRGRGKLLLRELACRYLPRDWIDAPKRGFGIPMTQWGREELLGAATKLLESDDSRIREAFGSEAVERFMSRQRSPDGFATYQVWALSTLESWCRKHPAILPTLKESRAVGRRASSLRPSNSLMAWQVNKSLFVVWRRLESNNANASNSFGDSPDTHYIASQARMLISEFAAIKELDLKSWHWDDEIADGEGPFELFSIPGVMHGLTNLEGATLLFFEPEDASESLGYEQLTLMAGAGVLEVVFPHPHSDDLIVRIKFRRRAAGHRALTVEGRELAMLKAKAISLPKAVAQMEGYRHQSGIIRALPSAHDVELSDRFMLFEGTRQLPPVPASHNDIARLGGGRYSIWNQTCIFSPSGPVCEAKGDYWLVEKSRFTSQLLPIITDYIERSGAPRYRPTLPNDVSPTLFAWKVNKHCFALAGLDDALGSPLPTKSELDLPHWKEFNALLLRLAFSGKFSNKDALIIDKETALANGCAPLPGWADDEGAVRQPLKGAWLLVPHGSVAEWLGGGQVHRFRQLGVEKLIFLHPHFSNSKSVVIRLQKKNILLELLDLFRLRWRGVPLTRYFDGRRILPTQGNRCDVGPLSNLPPASDTEMSDSFLLFEGMRQLPPVPVTHADIEQRGEGRYSIWNQWCIFSRLSTDSAPRSHFWLVEKDDASRDRLPIYPECIPFPAFSETTSFPSRVSNFIAQQASPEQPSRLQPGDSVIVMTHGLPPGGAERQWCYLALSLLKKGYRVTVLLSDSLDEGDNRHYLQMLQASQVEVLEIDQVDAAQVIKTLPNDPETLLLLHPETNPFGFRLAQLSYLLALIKPKALFAQLDSTNLLAGIAGHVASVPHIVMSFRNYNPSNFWYLRNSWFQPLYQTLAESSRTLFSGNSTDANRDYAKWIGVAPERVTLIPNAIDTSLFARPDTHALNILAEDLRLVGGVPVILGVFRLSEEKEPLAFLEVCAGVHRIMPSVRVIVAGVGPMQAAMEIRIQELGLEETVTLLGKRKDIAGLMSLASLLLSTSSFEGMSNVIMEAQLLGLPVVATRTGANEDILQHGRGGYVCPVGDVEILTQSCLEILTKPQFASEMASAASERIKTEFTLDLLAERHIQLINDRCS
ncbi:asparagine synthase (glutamine-hydrolyzing) [Methyloterricola oryzae]|uniref:asparagine synthase (glutamine-hydrolyzing) n=1 Tax=Methyloterricola oryzae TaxID=1495050 RepID=UPI0009E22FA5|nr:asparagine synthase (glutamine-hydrolyzing) [Methyloterricola oryzae]